MIPKKRRRCNWGRGSWICGRPKSCPSCLRGRMNRPVRGSAYQRYREIERASDLLRALLAWVLGGCSFRQLGCWAVLLGVADISEAAWRKRVRKCGQWLQWLLSEVMTPVGRAARPNQPRVILVDGTSLGETGGTGDAWRVQLADDLVEGRLVDVQVGDHHQAETMDGLPGRAGDLFVGDRGYGVRRNVIAVDEMQAASEARASRPITVEWNRLMAASLRWLSGSRSRR